LGSCVQFWFISANRLSAQITVISGISGKLLLQISVISEDQR
jgi:hypothetical protein